MPSHQRRRCREPTDRGVAEDDSKPPNRPALEQGKRDGLADSSRKPPQKRSQRLPEPDQGRRQRHQQQMLEHVKGQQVRVA